MFDILAHTHYSNQARLHIEAGDFVVAREWAERGITLARAKRDDRAGAPCVLLLALALFGLGDHTRARRKARAACQCYERVADHLGLGVALVCSALLANQGRFRLLAEADVTLETGMMRLAQRGDVERWEMIRELRWRIENNVEALLPMAIEAGFVGIHGLEPGAGMDLVKIKREFGQDLVLIGNVDVRLLFDSDLEAVRREVDRCIEQGAPGGGYMIASCNSIYEGMNPAAVAEMFRYEGEVGFYGGRLPANRCKE